MNAAPMTVLGFSFPEDKTASLIIDIGPLETINTAALPGFNERLLNRLPGLRLHTCCFDAAGGFVRRLRDGTWMAHVVEHVALEVQIDLGYPVSIRRTSRLPGRAPAYRVDFEVAGKRTGRAACRHALELIQSLLPIEFHGVEALQRIWPHAVRTRNPASAPYLRASSAGWNARDAQFNASCIV